MNPHRLLLCCFIFNLLRFFPNFTVWISILNSADWPHVLCAWNSWQNWPDMCLRASMHTSHAIPLKKLILEPRIWVCSGAEAGSYSQWSGLCLSSAQRINEPAETQWVQNAAVPKLEPCTMPASCRWQHLRTTPRDGHIPRITVVMSGHLSTNKPGKELGSWSICRKASYRLLFFTVKRYILSPYPSTQN